MRRLYSLLMYLALPLFLMYFTWRGLRESGYLKRWSERLGRYPGSIPGGGLVIHTASLGEVNAAIPLCLAILRDFPEYHLTITTFTPTGSDRVKSVFGNRVTHVYAPLDAPGAVQKFLAWCKPRLIVIMETEVWPNLYRYASEMGIPLIVSNARLSERSMRAFKRFPRLARDTLASVTWFGAQTSADADRLIACGARHQAVEVAGNIKFDHDISPTLTEEARALRASWGSTRPVLTAGSTHAEDEAILLSSFESILRQCPDALLIMAPRHPDRFKAAITQVEITGFRHAVRSRGDRCDDSTQVLVVDTMGELLRYLACCDVAFVGGTLAAVGGHNPLEPMALGKPVVFGPNTTHIAELTQQLLDCGGGQQVESAPDLADTVAQWFLQDAQRLAAGEAAQSLAENGRGALKHTVQKIRAVMARI